jgi:hypothetical protein
MVVCSIFIIALSQNVSDSVAYLDNHPQLSSNQVDWFAGYWPVPYLAALLVVAGTPIYLDRKNRKIKPKSSAKK